MEFHYLRGPVFVWADHSELVRLVVVQLIERRQFLTMVWFRTRLAQASGKLSKPLRFLHIIGMIAGA